jgi:hypothetical protein
MPKGDGTFTLYLHAAMRKSARVDVGDIVTIGLDFDFAFRNVPMHPTPDWFRAELESDPVATVNWDALTSSRPRGGPTVLRRTQIRDRSRAQRGASLPF